MVITFRSDRLGSVGTWIWKHGQGLWAFALPVLILLKVAGVIDWSWWWVALSPLWVSNTSVVTSRFDLPGSVGARIWNRGQGLWALALPVLIVLKLTGVTAWSWWWVLSPLWISGILLLVPVLCVLLVLLGWHIRRRAMSSAVWPAQLR